MVIMSEKSRAFLMENLPAVVNADEPNDILEALYDLIMAKGFNPRWEGYNSFGDEAQEVYDDIFDSNFDD